ncbi:hypothetical protein D3C86_1289620 [compost metagenome]
MGLVGDVIGVGLGELSVLIAGVDQGRAVGTEAADVIGHVAGVFRDQVGLSARLQVGQIDVGVGAGVRLDQGDQATVAGYGRDVEARVLEHQLPLIGGRVIGVDVEGGSVAFVAGQPEGLAVVAEADEASLDLVARRQVAQRPVGLAHIDVGQLVAALIRRHQDAAAVGEIALGEGGVGGRGGQGHGIAARDGQGVGVEHAGLIRRDQDVAAALGEGQAVRVGHREAGRLEELGGGVGRGGGRSGLGLAGRSGFGRGEGGDGDDKRQGGNHAGEGAHSEPREVRDDLMRLEHGRMDAACLENKRSRFCGVRPQDRLS